MTTTQIKLGSPYSLEVWPVAKTLTVAEALRKAKSLIKDPDKWGQGAFFKDGKMCVLGAVFEVVDHTENGGLLSMVTALQQAMHIYTGRGAIADWNDTHTHEQLMLACDRAILIAERTDHGS